MVVNKRLVFTYILCIHDIPNFFLILVISKLCDSSVSFSLSQIFKNFSNIFIEKNSCISGPAQFKLLCSSVSDVY